MERDTYQRAARAAIRYLLLVLTLIYLISGLGITQYQIIEPLTLGLLTRNLAFRIHDFLLVPLEISSASLTKWTPSWVVLEWVWCLLEQPILLG